VTGKFLETFFRHKLLILLPAVLIPLLVGPIVLLMAQSYYEAWAGIWVERPTYFRQTAETERLVTPAQGQSSRLSELLRSRTFLSDVAVQTPLAPLVGSATGEEKLQRIMETDLALFPSGDHLLMLRFRAETPQRALQVIEALVETFKERSATDRAGQAELAITFYEARVQTAEEQLAKTEGAMRRYAAANPRVMDALSGASGASRSGLAARPTAMDPQVAELLRRVELDERDVERARTSLDQARLEASASVGGQELALQVIDPPQIRRGPTRDLRKLLVFPVAALAAGLGLSTALLLLLVAADRSVRTEADLAATARVVGVLPRLRTDRVLKGAGPDASRRAIGFVAGAALPAPRGAK